MIFVGETGIGLHVEGPVNKVKEHTVHFGTINAADGLFFLPL